MANWKKMAEAFGRAMNRPDLRNEMNTLGKNSKQGIRDRADLYDRMSRSAGESIDTDVAFTRGLESGEDQRNIVDAEMESFYKKHPDENRRYAEEQRVFDDLTDDLTDAGLQYDFTKLFEQAAAKASPELRVRAIEMLQRGESIPDVLDVLKWGD